jgi:hypothetical protein
MQLCKWPAKSCKLAVDNTPYLKVVGINYVIMVFRISHSKVDAIRNQHPYVSNYVSAKSGTMWHLEKKKKVQVALQ